MRPDCFPQFPSKVAGNHSKNQSDEEFDDYQQVHDIEVIQEGRVDSHLIYVLGRTIVLLPQQHIDSIETFKVKQRRQIDVDEVVCCQVNEGQLEDTK